MRKPNFTPAGPARKRGGLPGFLFSFCGILLPALVMTPSCRPALQLAAGVRQPEIESKSSVQSFLKSIGQDTAGVYGLDTVAFNRLRSEPFKPGWKPGFRPVQIRVYDRQGNPVMQWASCEGYLKDLRPFDSVPPRNTNGLNTSLTLGEDLKQYYTLDGKPAGLVPEPGYDLSLLVYFARYFPMLSEESFRQVADYRKKHPELRMRIYKIDVDFLEFWGVGLQPSVTVQKGGSPK